VVPTPAHRPHSHATPDCGIWMKQKCLATEPCAGINSTQVWTKDCGICKYKHCTFKDLRSMLAVSPCAFRCKLRGVPRNGNTTNSSLPQGTQQGRSNLQHGHNLLPYA
jgi:hypothetical protein